MMDVELVRTRSDAPPREDAHHHGADADRLVEERLWVELILEGDVNLFRRLVERYQGSVRGVILRLVGSQADTDDLAQQAFLRAFQALGDFKTELRFSSWLLRIAVNAAKDHLKSKKRGESSLSSEPTPDEAVFAGHIEDPEGASLSAERRAEVHAALSQLPWKYREVLVLKSVEELPYEEIQRILELPLTTLKIRVVRAREMLRKLLEESNRS